MTKLLQRMHDELVRRNDAGTTIRTYLHAVNTCRRQHSGRRLDHLGPRELRRYQAYLFEERKLAIGTVGGHAAALRFFFVRVLKRRALKEELPTPKRRRRLPTVSSPEEVRRLIAGAKNLYHCTMLLTLSGAGLRRSELCHLKVGHLDRDTHRVAISNHRLLAFDGDHVTFSYKDYAHGDRRRTMRLTAMEFLRRFVQHILPRGFVRIRQSGFLANTCRTARVKRPTREATYTKETSYVRSADGTAGRSDRRDRGRRQARRDRGRSAIFLLARRPRFVASQGQS